MKPCASQSTCASTTSLICLLLILLTLILMPAERSTAGDSGFVQTEGSRFLLNGKPFFFGGANCYFLMVQGVDPAGRAYVDEILERAAALGLTVIRTWGFNDGPRQGCLQCGADGELDAAALDSLDYVISKADALGLRVVLPLANYWPDYGGMDQYIAWTGADHREDFYTNAECRDRYKRYVEKILSHRNAYSHRLYKDDPAIFSFELANEPEAQTAGMAALNDWVAEMSAYIKGLDQNHLISTGLEGFYSSAENTAKNPSVWMKDRGMDFCATQNIPTIDFAVAHSLPDDWGVSGWEAIRSFHVSQIAVAHNGMRKPFVLEEFAKRPAAVRDEWLTRYVQLMESERADGWMVWMLGCSGRSGDDGYWIYPGDAQSEQILRYGASAARSLIPEQVVRGVCSLKCLPVGTSFYTSEPQVVSAIVSNGFYVQEHDRCGGILVTGKSPVSVGGTVRIGGYLRVGSSGQRIEPLFVDPVASAGPVPRPLGMRISSIGGEPPAGWTGSPTSPGLYNLGLLTTVPGIGVPPVAGDTRCGFTFFDRTDSLGGGMGLAEMGFLFGTGGNVETQLDLPADPGTRYHLHFQQGPGWRDVGVGMAAPAGGLGGAAKYRLALRNDGVRDVMSCLFLEAGGWNQTQWQPIPAGATVINTMDLRGLPAPTGTIGFKVGLNVEGAEVTADVSAVGYYYVIDDGSGRITVLGSQPEGPLLPATGISAYLPEVGKVLLAGDMIPMPF